MTRCGCIMVGCMLSTFSLASFAQEVSLENRIQLLNRDSTHRQLSAIKLDFDTHHTQGMTRVGEFFFMTSVHAINRAGGQGKGFLYRFDIQGKLDRSIELGEGAIYHPGGIDYDGKYIWVSVAEYRPDSTSIVYRVDPHSMKFEEIFRFNDHLGGIVSTGTQLVAMSWGSRKLYRWDLDANGRVVNPDSPTMQLNSSHFIDYQDGQWIPGTHMLVFGGLASFALEERRGGSAAVGGIALVDAQTLMPVFELPLAIYSERGRVMNQNPFFVESSKKGLQIHFVPDDNRSTLYTMEFPIRLNRVAGNRSR